MDLELKGKVAIITGGSDGIGKAAAISMAAEGAKVAIVGRTQEKLDAAVAEVRNVSGGEAIGVAADVSVESDVKAMVDKVVGEFGQLDILVNNAGTSSATTLEQMTDEQLKVDFGIKVYGAIYCARAALPHLKKSGAVISGCRNIPYEIMGGGVSKRQHTSKYSLCGSIEIWPASRKVGIS